MNSVQVKCVIEAARCRSFAEAAERLYMTPSTLGRHISSLEDELDILLFERGRKVNKLTLPGEVVYAGLLEMSERMTSILEAAERVQAGADGRLSLGILEGQMVDEALSRMLFRIRENYPQLHVSLMRYSFREMEEQLLGGGLDIGVTLTQEVEDTPELEYKAFQVMENFLVLPAGHPLAKKEELSLTELKDTPLLGLEVGECHKVSQRMVASCIRAGFEPKRLLFPDLRRQLLALEAGLGMMPLNENHIACYNPRLTARRVPDLPEVEFCFAWNRDNHNPSISLFLENAARCKN